MSDALVAIDALTRGFGRREALAGIDLSLGPGEIVGLAGPNGSGKTTLLKHVAGFLRPSSGTVRVFGVDPFERREDVMRRARFAFAPPPLYEALSAREHLVRLTGLGRVHVGRGEIDSVLDLVGLSARARDRVRTFSFGMRQRLVLAQALLPTPELLVLDEPADGLDPLAVLELRAVLGRLREERGVAIVLSSHLLFELDQLVDRLLVLDEGVALFEGPPDDLRGAERVRLRAGEPDVAAAALRERGLDARVDGAFVDVRAGELDLESARGALADAGVALEEYSRHRPTLESALLERLRVRRDGGGMGAT